MKEEQEFLEQEIEKCDKEIERCKETINATSDCLNYYVRRKEFLAKIKDLIEI